MNRIALLAVAAMAASGLAAAPAVAKTKWHKPMHHASARADNDGMMKKAEVVDRDAQGHATVVMVDGTQYKVCSATVTDSCINPHQAGLSWGNTPLNYWPGKPASEIPGKLPANKPAM